ncbi:MAG: prepilin peptidase [Planctomycetaceae bacterium]|nr:prepilin peptidase [Planctomycetaceae bacterium]
MTAFDLPVWIVYGYLFVLGAVVGSFLNVCIYRIPQQETFWASLKGLANSPSACPRCGSGIRWKDNIPIIGWLKLGGRCRDCRMWISPRYPAIELLNGLLWVALYWLEVPSGWGTTIADSGVYAAKGPQGIIGSEWLSPEAVVHWRFAYHLVLAETLLVATFIDFDLWIIPDGVTLPAMAVGLIGSLLGQVYLVPVWFQSPRLMRDVQIVRDTESTWQWLFPEWLDPLLTGPAQPAWIAAHPHLHGLAVSVVGLLVGGGVVWLLRIIGHTVLRREAMGFGDVVLMAMVGSFLGWQPTVIAFFLAPLFACVVVLMSVFSGLKREIPYGPYLSLGTLAVLFGWTSVWPSFERVFSIGVLVVPIAVMMALGMFLLLVMIQFGKWLLGMELVPPPYVGEWRAADQNQYQDSERNDRQQGQWRRPGWPGTLSGRGQIHWNNWRHPLQ